MSLNETPSANRLHIALYGRRNSGKSSLINALTGQRTALVSDVAGTTTDPVTKAMEIPGVGACVFIDTAGFDDAGSLGALRVDRTAATLQKADLALLVFSAAQRDISREIEWAARMNAQKLPFLALINQSDSFDPASLTTQVEAGFAQVPICVSAKTGAGIRELLSAIARSVPESFGGDSITRGLVKSGEVVLLVMPQDSEAPKGRLILPQVQTIRDLLDNGCISVNATPETMSAALAALKQPPALVITDSQAFAAVAKLCPPQSRLTSFSVLFAAYKGDLSAFVEGAAAADRLTETSRVLIAEACTHAPRAEDIGRVKIPALLRKRFGSGLTVDVASGTDFPADLTPYDLVVHCGGCMFNRRYLLSRVAQAASQKVPITNYGVLLAKLNGILDQISLGG